MSIIFLTCVVPNTVPHTYSLSIQVLSGQSTKMNSLPGKPTTGQEDMTGRSGHEDFLKDLGHNSRRERKKENS